MLSTMMLRTGETDRPTDWNQSTAAKYEEGGLLVCPRFSGRNKSSTSRICLFLILFVTSESTDGKLLHSCDLTIIEWAELVSEFLQQDSSQPVLDGLKPLPSEEFNFWKNRLKNLHFIQQQVTTPH